MVDKKLKRICPVCGEREVAPNSKTCGYPVCKGTLAEQTKGRVKRQKEAESQIRSWAKQSKVDFGEAKVCVVC